MNHCKNCPVRQTAFHAKLRSHQIDRISCIMHLKRLGKGRPLFFDGDSGERIFAIRSGVVKAYKTSSGGKEQILKLVLPGNMLGLEIVKLPQFPYSATVVSDAEICYAEKADLLALMEKYPDLAMEVVSLLTEELEQARNRIKDLGMKNATQRVASFVLDLMPVGECPEARRTISTPLSRQEISEYLGLTMETVSRTLSQLHRERVIDVDRSLIRIMNLPRLITLGE